jgi:hypothetical protein
MARQAQLGHRKGARRDAAQSADRSEFMGLRLKRGVSFVADQVDSTPAQDFSCK